MADTKQIPAVGGMPTSAQSTNPRPLTRQQQLNKIYTLPAPLRTFPLPTFVPHNPLSLFHILYVWISQTIKPQTSHFETLYQALFSPETRSVHVTDSRSIRGLWEQGFYGKGTLSRSEPSWLDREKTRRGEKTKSTSEENTRKRRAERQETKWERARKERELIDQTLLEEAAAIVALPEELVHAAEVPVETANAVEEMNKPPASPTPLPIPTKLEFVAPVGPLELLALPNSLIELEASVDDSSTILCFAEDFDEKYIGRFYAPPVGPLELLALPNSLSVCLPTRESSIRLENLTSFRITNSQVDGPTLPDEKANGRVLFTRTSLRLDSHTTVDDLEMIGGSETNEDTLDESTHSEETTETNGTPPNGLAQSNGDASIPKIKRQKSVRFSPTVEKNTFLQSEPPSPERAAIGSSSVKEAPLVIQNQEHLQLTLEEAFFLSYALGAISILDPETKVPISNQDLFYLFRKASYFPPRPNPSLSPDDSFMINYVVYHHYRSLGWVVRSGIKFSVDYMLYNRGPVFTHAEFGIVVLPSYSDPYWTSDPFLEKYSKEKQQRTWAWMSCINRVITQVKKTLILTYVDIPKPLSAEEEQNLGIDGVLARYKVREIVMRRFAANRMRD
jgi:tRNA-splicing endonuclease subunit Sen2